MFARPYLDAAVAGLPLLHLCWVWQRRGGRFAMPFDTDGGRRFGSGRLMRALLGVGESMPALLMAAVAVAAGRCRSSSPRPNRSGR